MKTYKSMFSLLTVAGLLAVSLFSALVPAGILAQTDSKRAEELKLPIGLTEEEKTRLHEIGKYHRVTAAPVAPIRKCAEWEPVTGVLIRYNNGFGIPISLIREYAEDITVHILCGSSQQSNCYNSLYNNGVNMNHVEFINCETNSMWTRDYGPQAVFAGGLWGMVDHIYNRPRPYDDDVPVVLGNEWSAPVYGTNLVHTGGNFMSDGHGTGFSTDLVWDENSGMTHSEISREMEDFLGITNYVVIPDISSSGIHHIDCWAKLLDEETILVKEVSSGHSHYDELEANVAYLRTLTNCYGRPYKIVRVYCGSIGGSDVASYTNSLILNNKVFVPVFGISSDAAALATYEAAMPGYEVLGIDGSWLDDDAVHCRGMEIHDRYMLVVDTNPLRDRESNDGDYRVTAFIDDRSEAGLVTDSLLVYWRLEDSTGFNTIVMQGSGYTDSYYADIPRQVDLVNIEYYVFAKDNTNRRETRPMVAPAALYSFNTGGSQALPVCLVQPDNIDFGTVTLGDYKEASFTITNIGGGTLSGGVSEYCDCYGIISGGGAYSLSAGQSITVTVRFEPNSEGTHVCSIETGDGICNDVYCNAEAYGVPPTASFTGSPTSGEAPLTVQFTDQSTSNPASISWSWAFGDGGSSTERNPSHQYNEVGIYTVSLTATNAYGSDNETRTDYITVTAPGGDYAGLPYTTGFESGDLDQCWITGSTDDGRIRVLSSNGPHSGSRHICLDDATRGGYSRNEAWLRLNLAGRGEVDLEFWWKEFGDETHSQDGVYFSDDGGSSFVKVFDLRGSSYGNQVWNEFSLDVDELAASAGLSLTGTFVIKFQQYDNYPMTTDGFAFDDISVVEAAPEPPVAAFSAAPTSGTAPLSVQFTDESTGSPTSWSWDFGDGSSSTEQNPGHTYTAEGTYAVTLTVANAIGSDDESKEGYITVNEPGSITWTVITYDDFEGGMGNYTDGGGDMHLYTSGTYAHEGSNAARIRDNSGTYSSFYHTTGCNVTGYTELEVEFWFCTYSMEPNEDFWLQYYDGSTWHMVASYARGADFSNKTFYNKVVTISSSLYKFPADARLRFMCDASGNRDYVYIDEIEFRGLSGGISVDANILADKEPSTPGRFELFQNYPNPFNPVTTISFSLTEAVHVRLDVFDVAGRKVSVLLDGPRDPGVHHVEFNASSLGSGVYFYRLIAGDKMEYRKMILLQ